MDGLSFAVGWAVGMLCMEVWYDYELTKKRKRLGELLKLDAHIKTEAWKKTKKKLGITNRLYCPVCGKAFCRSVWHRLAVAFHFGDPW